MRPMTEQNKDIAILNHNTECNASTSTLEAKKKTQEATVPVE